MKIRLFLLVAISVCAVCVSFAQIQTMPSPVQKLVKTNFRSWEMAEQSKEILEYYRSRKPADFPNAVKGDWNGDGKTDYAFLLQRRSNKEERILVAVIGGKTLKSHVIADGDDCIMSEKKGQKGFDFERQKTFFYKSDAIFSYIWEKAGTSYFWQNGRFRGIATSD